MILTRSKTFIRCVKIEFEVGMTKILMLTNICG